MLRLAFAGFRHGHAMALYRAAAAHKDIRIVAACEEDRATAAALREAGTIPLTHGRFQEMLEQVDCDAIGIGDYYAARGPMCIAALERGRHVISDKPICIRLDELARIETLARRGNLCIGCLLDLRGSAPFLTARRLVHEQAIGQVHTVTFLGQHPLLWGARPGWYFEPGLQGGTLNDIAIHALDAIPWITGRRVVEVVAARAWNARLPQVPHFQDAAQLMLRLDNGGGVLGDVSYLAPDACGYTVPQYWRMTFHGDGGMIECSEGAASLQMACSRDRALRDLPLDAPVKDAAIESFLAEVRGDAAPLSTADVLAATRLALEAQRRADRG